MLLNRLTFTNLIIVITFMIYLIQINMSYGNIYLGLNINFLDFKLYYQPLSTMFAHGSWAHIIMNMFVLFQFGNMLEEYLGGFRFLLLYLIGGIATSLISFLFILYVYDGEVNLVGASGAISVILGYIAIIDSYQRKGIIIWILLISFAPLLLGVPVAWYAHLIGFAVGMLFSWVKV